MFSPELQLETIERLSGAGDDESDRCRRAILKLSDGEIDGLQWAFQLYRTDYRDLLMAAGFNFDCNEHNRWADEYLATFSDRG